MISGGKAHIGVVAGDPLRSLGLVSVLEEMPGVTAASVDLETALHAEEYSALLVHLHAPVEAVIASIGKMRKARSGLKLIVMSETLLPEDVQSVIGAGAKGFVAETASINEIVMAVEVVLDGSIWAPRKVLAALIESTGNGSGGARERSSEPIRQMLTDRERDVLQLLMNGRSNREIAAAMGIEPATVKAHLGRMLRKTKATNRVELTLRAMEERETKDELDA
jgi:DNA-binding NarL/FixJ family response regulator